MTTAQPTKKQPDQTSADNTVNFTYPLQPRTIGRVNWLGVKQLYQREVLRFVKVYLQTIASPVVTTLIFLAIFMLAFPQSGRNVYGVDFSQFLAPGLIMMVMVQNAFANTSSSLMIAKVQGNIVDTLLPPLSPMEMMVGYLGGGVTRGLMIGTVVAIVMSFFVHTSIFSLFHVLAFAVMATLMLSLLGLLTGVWSQKFDHMAAVTNFVITPLSFLSGTFYTIDRLPENFQILAHLNPFFYMIDGFRYGFIGHPDALPFTGLLTMLGCNIVLWCATYNILRKGYRLKA
jgi:ABC-2 type transport system permease protein